MSYHWLVLKDNEVDAPTMVATFVSHRILMTEAREELRQFVGRLSDIMGTKSLVVVGVNNTSINTDGLGSYRA